MKRILLATVFGLALAQPLPAVAQLAVTDPTSLPYLVQQLTQLQQQYTVLKQQWGTLQSTLSAVSHPTDVLSAGSSLLGSQSRLPGSATNLIPQLNLGSTLSGAGQQFFNQNRVYTPQGTDFNSTELLRRQQATANMQAEAQNGMDRAQQRLAGLDELVVAIPNQPDIAATSALQARIQAENTFLANEQSNVARLQLVQQTQGQVDQQRQEQNDLRGIEEWRQKSLSRMGGN